MAERDAINNLEENVGKPNGDDEFGKDDIRFSQNVIDGILRFIHGPKSESVFHKKVNNLDSLRDLLFQEPQRSSGEEEEEPGNSTKKHRMVSDPRVDSLENKIKNLELLLERKDFELEAARCSKETSVQEVKKYEIFLAINDAVEEASQDNVCVTQEHISKIVAAFETLKNQPGTTRACFTNYMISLNNRISKLVPKSVLRPNIMHFVGHTGIPFTGAMCSIFGIYLGIMWRLRDEELMSTQQLIKTERQYIKDERYNRSVRFGERLLQEIRRPWWDRDSGRKEEEFTSNHQVVPKTQPLDYFSVSEIDLWDPKHFDGSAIGGHFE